MPGVSVTNYPAIDTAICVRLCKQGANTEALVIIIRELVRETEAIKLLNGE